MKIASVVPLLGLKPYCDSLNDLSIMSDDLSIIFHQLNILPLKKLFQRVSLQMFKYEFGIIPIALHNLFEKRYVHTYYTRHMNMNML